MIVGTSGHIDHGKTTLVRALTGVDTDRLPEEKKRGISIELGYAFLDSPTQRIGFIDVPGHERLVHTMLAGATGIDVALLLVAADDGVMPQTREHLAVLALLGIRRAAVVVTKIDRVDAQQVQAVRSEVSALLDGTPLAGSVVFDVSAQQGDGIDALKAWLVDAAAAASVPTHDGKAFRLAIDRAFTLGGVGTVVTGTVHAGTVKVGDELRVAPGDITVRVRSVHAQNQPMPQAHAGQRCAVALAGIAKEQVSRGQWLVAPAAALGTARIDTTLTLWHVEPRALRSGARVQVHLGAASATGVVALLDGDTLAPGASAHAQLVLQAPIGAWHGDRVVLRDASASRTIAGGTVLDSMAPTRYRRTPQRLAELDALANSDSDERLAALLTVAPNGIDLKKLGAAWGQSLQADPPGGLRHTSPHGDWVLGAAQTSAAHTAVRTALAHFHTQHPDELGPDASRLRRLALPRWPEPLWRALLTAMQRDATLAVRGAFVHLPEHGVRLSATEERVAQKVAPLLRQAAVEGAWTRDLARATNESEPLMRVTLARLAQRGDLHQVVKDLYYPPATLSSLATIAREVAAAHAGEVSAAAFRDRTPLGRKRAIQILEYFDRIGLLRRVGDVHKLRSDSTLFEAVT